MFWRGHNPTRQSWSVQYRSVILFHSEAQQQVALNSKDQQAQKRGAAILTDIAPMHRFYLAEDYHQKYSLRYSPELLAEFSRYYATTAQMIQSTAVARVNGYLGGDGTAETLEAEIDSYGLSSHGKKALMDRARRFFER